MHQESLYSAWINTGKLRESVKAKRAELQFMRQTLKLISILKGQVRLLATISRFQNNFSRIFFLKPAFLSYLQLKLCLYSTNLSVSIYFIIFRDCLSCTSWSWLPLGYTCGKSYSNSSKINSNQALDISHTVLFFIICPFDLRNQTRIGD